MDFKNFILENYVLFFEILGLFIISFISIHIPKRMKIFTRFILLLLFLACLVNSIESWTHTFETFSIWRHILTATKYTLYPLTLMLIVELMYIEENKISLKIRLLLYLPLIICIPIFYTSQWTGIVCSFSMDNTYHGGTLKLLPYALCGFYVVVFIIQNTLYLKYYKTRDKLIILYITLGSIICVVLYLVCDLETLDYTPIFVAALIFYYFFTYIHMSSIDTLTGLMNRQSYYEDINNNKDRIKAVISIDMNELKYINDTYGHAKGDEALVTISKILLENCGNSRALYRTGGDEFIMLLQTSNKEEIENKISFIKSELAKTSYSCAFGYAINTNNNVDETLKIADDNMYIDKNNIKEMIVKNGGSIHQR